MGIKKIYETLKLWNTCCQNYAVHSFGSPDVLQAQEFVKLQKLHPMVMDLVSDVLSPHGRQIDMAKTVEQ